MKHYSLFRILTVVTVVLGALVSEMAREEFFSVRLLFGLSVIYAASIFIRDYFYKADTTFFDFDHRGLREPKEDLIIFGTRVEDLAQQSKERRVLIGLIESSGGRYKVYLAWILSLGAAIYLNLRPGGASVLDIVAPVIILSGIYFAPFLSQLLVPTFFSLLLTVYKLSQVRTPFAVIAFILFFISFIATLAAYREIDSDRANAAKKVRATKLMRSTLSVAALFVVLYFIVDFALPEQNPFRSQVTRDPIEIPKGKLSTDKLSRDLAETLLKWQEKADHGRENSDVSPGGGPGGPGGPSGGGPGGDGKIPNFKPPSGGGAEPNLVQGDKEGRPGGGGAGGPDAKSLRLADSSRASEKGPTNPEQSLEGPAPQSGPENGEKTNDKLKGEAGNESETSGPGGGNAEGHGKGHADGHADGRAKNRGDDNGQGGNSADGGGGDGLQDRPGQRAGVSSPDGKASPGVAARSREKKIEEIKHKVKVPLEVAKGLLVILAIVAVFLVISKFFSSRKDEDPEKEIRRQQLTERQKKRLQAVLGQIRARNLMPDQEIVETYNALLVVFELGHFPREEWLPAEDFSNQIEKDIPPVSKYFSGATVCFSRTLYGQKTVGDEDLKVFRENVARILRFFQVD